MNKRKWRLWFIIITILFIISIAFNVYSNVQYVKIKNDVKEKNDIIKERENELNSSLEVLTKIQNGKTTDYILTKLNFLDQKITFVVNSDNKHYYNYECMMKTMKIKNMSLQFIVKAKQY